MSDRPLTTGEGAAIARERETRHWTIPQWKEAAPDEHWPRYVAEVQAAADAEVDALLAEYGRLREQLDAARWLVEDRFDSVADGVWLKEAAAWLDDVAQLAPRPRLGAPCTMTVGCGAVLHAHGCPNDPCSEHRMGADALAGVGEARPDGLREQLDAARRDLKRAAYLAEHLWQMIHPETWRDTGGDDGQGHYEGDYHAEQTRIEIQELAARAALGVEGEVPPED